MVKVVEGFYNFVPLIIILFYSMLTNKMVFYRASLVHISSFKKYPDTPGLQLAENNHRNTGLQWGNRFTVNGCSGLWME